VADEVKCPECGNPRPDPTTTCPLCGAPPIRPNDHRGKEEEVRTDDLQPYVTLRYVARMFKVLAVIVTIVMIAEAVLGLLKEGLASLPTIVPEITQMLVIGGVMWAGGDITVLLIDMGHDIRVARILLGRINSELHRRGGETS
jgi:hypothetical protein